MSDFADRLAAQDPAAGRAYHHRDLDALIAKVTATPALTKRSWWESLHLRVSGTLIAGALITAGSVAVFQGGSSLPVLALATAPTSHSSTPTRSTSATTVFGMMQINEEFVFRAGPGLTATTPTSDSYELHLPPNAAEESSRLARVFGVAGTPSSTDGDDVTWSVTDASGDTVNYTNAEVPQWSYAASISSSDGATSDLPSRATVASDAAQFLNKLGYGYALSSPSFATSTSRDALGGSTSTTDVTYVVDVDGVATDQSLSLSVDAHNDVVSASGPAFAVAPPTLYPLVSLRAGVSALNAAERARFAPTAPATNATAPAGASAVPTLEVTLDADSLSLKTYQLQDGSLWLLPVYEYAGVETNPNGIVTHATWYQLAIDPQYVRGGSVSTDGPNRY